MIPGGASYKTLEKIGYLEQIADDPAQPAELREHVTAELERIDVGAPVHPIYQAVRTTAEAAQDQREAELHRLAADALDRAKSARTKKRRTPRPISAADEGAEPAKYPVRAFVLTWTELAQWWTHYDADQLAGELSDEQIESFFATTIGTSLFADDLRAALDRQTGEDPVPARGRLRAL